MAAHMPQTFANHTRLDPLFHFFILPAMAISVVVAAWNLVQGGVTLVTLWSVVAAAALLFAVLRMRIYALTVQDRLIMLEERLRLRMLLPDRIKARTGELDRTQLLALRFAPDAEIPALVERTLNEKLSCIAIKKAIENWRPDHHRV